MSIIGAGTAGLIAAKELAESGISTTVYDQRREPGYPIYASGILSIKGLESLGMNYRQAITNTLWGANIHSGGKTMAIMSKQPIAHVLDRREMNKIFLNSAERKGAHVVLGKRKDGRDFEDMRKNSVIVGADGAVSTVAKHFGMGKIKSYVLTYKAEYNIKVPDPRMVDLYFDNKKYPNLFAWTCPNASDLLEVGIGVDPYFKNAHHVYNIFAKGKEMTALIGRDRPVREGASIIPMGLREKLVDEKNGVVLIGDAAGQVKPTTGGGIIFGGNAARMAASAIKNHVVRGAKLSVYEKSFKKKFGKELAIHSAINKTYSAMGPGAMGAAISLLNVFGFHRFLGRYGDMDMPSVVIKRFFLRGLAK